MKKQLHILKSGSDLTAQSMIETLSRNYPENIKVVLIQEGVKVIPTWKAKTYLLQDSSSFPKFHSKEIETIDYHQFVDLIFEADTVVGW